MSLISTLVKKPSNLTTASKFHKFCGLFYLQLGLGLVLRPDVVQVFFRDRAFEADESGLIRAIGLTVAVIGWHYYFGARTGGEQVVAAGVIDRLIFVPLVCLPLAFAGVFPHLFICFTLLDVGLAIVAWTLLRSEASSQSFGSAGRAV
jgi:hypothetical protein